MPVIGGNIILVTIVLGIVAAVIAYSATSKNSDNSSIPLGLGVIFFVISAIFILMIMKHSREKWGISSSIGTIGIIFKSLWYTVFGIGKIFKITYSYVLFVICLQGSVYATALTYMIGRHKYKLPERAAKEVAELENKKALISKEANAKRTEIRQKWESKEKNNPYWSAYYSLPRYQQDYGTVTSLIWAIENGYAYDIPGARNYWDRKANDAAVQRQLAQVQATADAALRAAQTPPEVKVDVTVWN